MTVHSLEQAKLLQFQDMLADKLNELEDEGCILYEKAIADGHLEGGCYDDERWPAPTVDLLFGQAMGLNNKYWPQHSVNRQAYTDDRCVRFIKAYTATKLWLSETQRRQHNQAAKLILHIVDNNIDNLATLSKKTVEDFIRAYQQQGGGSANGIETRIAGEGGLISWMRSNGMLYLPFRYNCVLTDKHKLARNDTTSPEAAEKINNKRPPAELDTALGEVLLKTENGNNEPKEGYFRLRALMCSFMMAAGLRIGEAATLSVDCFVDINDKTWLKVLSEKAGEPRLVPLGAGWETLLKKQHKEVLLLTESARKSAMAMEDGTLYQQQRTQLEVIAKDRVLGRGYKHHPHLWDPSNGYFKWNEYVEAGLLPKFSDSSEKHQNLVTTGEQVLKSTASLFIAFDAYESWASENHRSILSDHFKNALKELELDTPELVRAGYSIQHPLSQHLFIKLDDQFHRARPTKPHLPFPLNQKDIQRFLRSSQSTMSAFEELNIRKNNAEVFELRAGISTHIFRHWKDDARFRAGGNESAIALLSGRAPSQNRAYDKRTAAETAEQHKTLYMQSMIELLPRDPLGKYVARMMETGSTQAEIEALVNETLQIMHLTPWGGCSRDLDREPCPKHYKCLRGFGEQGEYNGACANFHINPADPVARANIEHTLRVAKYQLSALERLTSPELVAETLADLEMDWNPERGHSMLAMHVKHQVEIIHGCEAALQAYLTKSAGNHKDRHGTQLRQVASVNRIHAVNLFDPSEAR
ncbi:tyrosine-type recombinase/integrase [Neptunomonas qingdaonensis]|uniref:Phage integrase family protein n=1 Tax=Neptunomonas qingdaonensis TaxID=1045558 RepID=A0A1I2R8Y2_9GAMM|nr:tyrosine-type recombinase/integrase [Neptunomonas qingdaonensis]SFG37144.1 Phage integrase family protein [Neptunomonas qingdaonensis]